MDCSDRCAKCGEFLRYNVPRLGPMGGYVHNRTGSILCGCPKCGSAKRSALGTHCGECLSELPPDLQTWSPQGTWIGGEGGDV
jgi:hypothetical protein